MVQIYKSENIWDTCKHEWEDIDSMSYLAVRCIKCQCPGEKNEGTGEVDWPTT